MLVVHLQSMSGSFILKKMFAFFIATSNKNQDLS